MAAGVDDEGIPEVEEAGERIEAGRAGVCRRVPVRGEPGRAVGRGAVLDALAPVVEDGEAREAAVVDDEGLAVRVHHLAGVGRVVLPVSEPRLEGGGSHEEPEAAGEARGLAVGRLHPGVGAFEAFADGLHLCARLGREAGADGEPTCCGAFGGLGADGGEAFGDGALPAFEGGGGLAVGLVELAGLGALDGLDVGADGVPEGVDVSVPDSALVGEGLGGGVWAGGVPPSPEEPVEPGVVEACHLGGVEGGGCVERLLAGHAALGHLAADVGGAALDGDVSEGAGVLDEGVAL